MLKYFGCHENIISLYDLVTVPYVSSLALDNR